MLLKMDIRLISKIDAAFSHVREKYGWKMMHPGGYRMRLAVFALIAALPLRVDAVSAAQLHVDPILLELDAPAAAGTLVLHNGDDAEVTVQTRVFRWRQVDGKESLEPTSEVVASPPAIKLTPKADYVVRVVRVAKQPVSGEESYRVVIDQLPNARNQKAKTVNLVIRQSIPVFFRAQRVSSPDVAWTLHHEGKKFIISATNQGEERMRIAALRLRDAAGTTVSFGNGLVGYALGRASMSWDVPAAPRGFGTGGTVSITAETNKGPIRATAEVRDRR
ncbi:MAG: molecular chaperone [Bradyrhizobium sp.]